jgi:anti-sigma28 factor (negative regulator of flagellin synthesis)
MYHHSSTCLLNSNTGRRTNRRVVTVKPLPTVQTPQEADIRHDLVARIRAEIAAGTYETPEKLSIALERMIDDVE